MVYRGPGTGDFVYAASPGCAREGCQLSKAAELLELARQAFESKGRTGMSAAMWCDAGGHAFSERDPGRQRITIGVLDEETGQEKEESRDFCGTCAERAGLLAKRRTRPAAIADLADQGATSDAPRYDPAYTQRLERELNIGGPGNG